MSESKGAMERADMEYYESKFLNLTQDISALFSSFQKLHDVYTQSFSQIQLSIDALPQQFKNEVEKTKKMLEACSVTVGKEQERISSQLYSQGLVLLVGASESLLREAFRDLIINNIEKVKVKDTVTFTFSEVIKNQGEKLASFVLGKIEDQKNPTEKLNFQNVKQMKGLFNDYFGVQFSESISFEELHRYWQIRHIVVHKRGEIDQKFLDNLKAAELDISRYKLGENIEISSSDFDQCKISLQELFKNLDEEIKARTLKIPS